MSHERRRKRRENCSNPLFVEWLTEWKEEATNKQLKAQHTYSKALHSLRKYPLTLYSGKECKLLEGFGDKICKMIDDRLEQYMKDLGQSAKEIVDGHKMSVSSSDSPSNSARSLSKRTRPVVKTASKVIRKAQSSITCIGLDSGSDNEDNAFGHRQENKGLADLERRKTDNLTRVASGREYIPQKNSGAYALLVMLYHHRKSNGDNNCSMTKKELMLKAQPLSTKSFTTPDPGSFYTAWSSMGTLLKKELVTRQSSPAHDNTEKPEGKRSKGRPKRRWVDGLEEDLNMAGLNLFRKSDGRQRMTLEEIAKDRELWRDVMMKYRITTLGADLAQRLIMADETTGTSPGSSLESQKRKETECNVQNRKKAKPTVDLTLSSITSASAGFSASDFDDGALTSAVERQSFFPNQRRQHFSCSSTTLDEEEESLPEIAKELNHYSTSGGPSSMDFQQNSSHGNSFQFAYVDEAGEEVLCKDKAVVCVDDEISVGFLIKAKYEDLLMSGKRYKLDNTRSICDGFVFAYLGDEDTPSVATFLWKNKQTNAPMGKGVSCAVFESEKTIAVGDVGLEQASSINSKTARPKFTFKSRADIDRTRTFGISNSIPAAQRTLSSESLLRTNQGDGQSSNSQLSVASSTGQSSDSQLPIASSKGQSSDSQLSVASSKGQSSDSQLSVASASELQEPDFVFPAGTFDVILYVDNHEYFRGTNYNEEMLIKELDKNCVRYKVTNLQLGDFLWVAKSQMGCRGADDDGNAALVLDYIIERKRMDDLASSIIDGRFKEQKFRLRACGISNPIYLVENYGSMQHFSIPEDSLNQAIINTQVVEGFFVKRTRDTKETSSYLTLMTRYLESIYKNKTLYGYRRHFKHGQVQMDGNEEKLMVFDTFNDASAKTKALTVSEMFGKHLMQLHGLTAEKATAVLQLYPTPCSLYEAYRKCNSEKERDEMLVNIKFGMTKRNIGKQMSKSIATLYYTLGQLK